MPIEIYASSGAKQQSTALVDPVHVIATPFSGDRKSVAEYDLNGFERNGNARVMGGFVMSRYDYNFWIATPEQIEELNLIVEEQIELDKRWRAALDQLCKVNRRNFDSIRKMNNGME